MLRSHRAKLGGSRTLVISLHTIAAVISLTAGPAIFLRMKGTPSHRALGALYIASMLTVAVSGLFIYELNGGLSPIHIFSVITFATISMGLLAIRRYIRQRQPEALVSHYSYMAYSYVGLLMAGGMQLLAEIHRVDGWLTAIGHFVVVCLIVFLPGEILVRRLAQRVLDGYGVPPVEGARP